MDPSLGEKLRERGTRLTRQRRILLEILEGSKTHLKAAELLRLAQKKGREINRATVYRTLALLKEEGLIDELDLLHLQGEEHFYEARRAGDHIHIVCPRCGMIEEMESQRVKQLTAEIELQTGGKLETMRIEARVECKECRGRVQVRKRKK